LRRRAAFTLVELMIVVAIVGLLAGMAIPNFVRFQLKSKTSEAKINLSAIRVVEESYNAEWGTYASAAPAPAVVPGRNKAAFASLDFDELGWAPVGDVFFAYSVAVSADGAGFTAEAVGDVDGDLVPQRWGYAKADRSGAIVAGVQGCNVAALSPDVIGPCDPLYGQSFY